MNKKIFFILVCIWTSGMLFSQTENRDSIQISPLLREGREYRLNDETLEAIRRGELINNRVLNPLGITTPSGTPLDTEYRKDQLFDNLNLLQIDRSGALLFQHREDSLLIVKSAIILPPQDIIVNEYFYIPNPTYAEETISMDDSFIPGAKVYDGRWIGTFNLGPHSSFSLENTLEEIFWPEERHKEINRRDANAWKYYNLQDMDD
ncbi:MAG: hypothetical protein LUG51_08705 [Tannerellaceae bacterium]|nr:hypothetical protein [Tannerellaceae bacterium]